MAILTPTKATGATSQPMPMLYVEPERQVTPEMLDLPFAGTGLNGAFLSDFLSAVLTHERCGRHLYRSCEGRSNNPMLQQKYREFGAQTERHVEILEQLIAGAGGNPAYVSAQARAIEGMDSKLLESTFMLDGSIDVMTAEMAMLDAVFVAESVDHANWQTLAQLTGELPEGSMRDAFRQAVDEVEQQEDEHLEWALGTRAHLTMLQARSDMLTTVGAKAEELVARVRNWVAD
jgi:rubrerythrin